MAVSRYGQIWHGESRHINIRFPSNEAREKFAKEFEAYHASHDHDGDIPTFKETTLKEMKLGTGDRTPHDLIERSDFPLKPASQIEPCGAVPDKDYYITMDGYSHNEISDYHNPSGLSKYTYYQPPTCCVPPIIVIDYKFVDSGTLQRHEFSAVFGDMPETDFQSLLESVQEDGFIDPIVRVHEGKILDGWHRYRAAQELNLIRKLKFQVWNEDKDEDGDPRAFVFARNIERRHYSASQRAQIVVEFNEMLNRGDVESQRNDGSPSGEPKKTRQELATEASVGTSTIDRAVAVKKTGQGKAVIAGDKTPGQIEREAKEKRYAKLCQAINAFNNVWQKTQLASQVSLSDDFFPAAAEVIGFPINTVDKVYHCQDTSASEEKMKGFLGIAISSWESYFDEMRTALIEKPEWVESLQNKTHTEDALQHLYQNRQDFQTAVSDFAQSGAYLDFSYCRRRIKELIGLEDSTDEGSTDYTRWSLQKIKEQSQIITETMQVIHGYLEEDPKIETHPVAVLLSEMQRLSDLHQSVKVHTPPFLHQPFADAIERIEMMWLPDNYEASPTAQRTSSLDALEAEVPGLIEAEGTARAESPEETVEVENTVDSLWEQIKPAIAAWKSARKGQGVGHASKTMFISATKRFHDLPLESETDVDLLEILLALVTEVQGRVYTFERYVKMQCDGASIWADESDEERSEDLPLQDALDEMKEESELCLMRERADTRRRRMWSYFASEIQVKHGKTRSEVSEEDFAKAAAEFLGLSVIRAPKNGIEYCFSAYKFILGDIALPPYALSDCTLSDAAMWANRFDMIAIALMNTTGWVKALLAESEADTDLLPKSGWATQHEHTLVAIERLKDTLKKFHVIDIDECVDDILMFYNGVELSDLSTSPEETLKDISDFIEGFVEQPLQAWPEYIRDSHHIPRRELVLVSIGISNKTDDAFELVEYTDEGGDEVWCKLNELPEELRTVLLKIAAERIYAEEMKECGDRP